MNRSFDIHPLPGPANNFSAVLITPGNIGSPAKIIAVPSARVLKTRRQAP